MYPIADWFHKQRYRPCGEENIQQFNVVPELLISCVWRDSVLSVVLCFVEVPLYGSTGVSWQWCPPFQHGRSLATLRKYALTSVCGFWWGCFDIPTSFETFCFILSSSRVLLNDANGIAGEASHLIIKRDATKWFWYLFNIFFEVGWSSIWLCLFL